MKASLYIHVPFCAGACDYCDFYSVRSSRDDSRQDRYLERILDEIAAGLDSAGIDEVPTLFVGGGTPTLLGPRRLEGLLKRTLELCPTKPEEITVEANPESLDEDAIAALRAGGANRLSVGVQSLEGRSRSAVCRIGTVESSLRALDLVSSSFDGRFSVDLIAGLPHQSEASLLSDIRRVLDAGATHVSLYSLILEEGTPLASRAAAGEAGLPAEEASDALWLSGRDALEAEGLSQYEVSNFARRGEECRHNLRYWRMESWLGFGPAASGTLVDEASGTARRITVPSDLDAWLKGEAPAAEEAIDSRALVEETIMMGFRIAGGPDEELFRRRFGFPMAELIGDSLASARERGHARRDRVALTAEGLLFLDPFVLQCLAELDRKLPGSALLERGYSK